MAGITPEKQGIYSFLRMQKRGGQTISAYPPGDPVNDVTFSQSCVTLSEINGLIFAAKNGPEK